MTRVLVALGVLVTVAGSTGTQSIRHIYRTAPSLVGLGGLAANGAYQNAADAILEQAIRNIPLFPGASSAYTYRWKDERARSSGWMIRSRPSSSPSVPRRSASA